MGFSRLMGTYVVVCDGCLEKRKRLCVGGMYLR